MKKERKIKNPEHRPEVITHQEDLVVPAGLITFKCFCQEFTDNKLKHKCLTEGKRVFCTSGTSTGGAEHFPVIGK